MDIDNIVECLKKGSVVAIRTDTVYGLICNAYDKVATEKIYNIKKREKRKPLSIFVKNVSEVEKYVDIDNLTNYTKKIMQKYWPGALTIIFNKKDDTFNHITSGSKGIGIRIPNDKVLLDILDKISFPLAETSCNISGEEDYKNYNEIKERLGEQVDLIVDGGEVKDCKPSTVISVECNEPIILRLGDVDISE